MLNNFKDVAETTRNRFAESPLGKQLEGMEFDNIDDSSLDAYANDVLDEYWDIEIKPQYIPGGLTELPSDNEKPELPRIPDEFPVPIKDKKFPSDNEKPELPRIPDEDQDIDLTKDISDEIEQMKKEGIIVYANADAEKDIKNKTDVANETKETYKKDDKGNIYSIDGKLKPNTTYELNGNIYTTDENGRIISCEAKPRLNPENPRDNDAQGQVGGEDRRPGDQGGHIVGRDMNGDGGIGNLVAMDSRINQSDYKCMENDIKIALNEGKDVTTKTEITYSDDSNRPDEIKVTVTVDGKDTIYKFDNNLNGSLRAEVPENGRETVQAKLDETEGEISSIKEEYDESGNLVKTTVYITYQGEDGTNYRTNDITENQ